MKNNETLDGSTAGFIAAIANCLARNITWARMKELTGDLRKLRMLLVPLIDDGLVHVAPQMFTRWGYGPKQVVFLTLSDAMVGPNSFRTLMREAYERKYAPLTEEHAKRLIESMLLSARVDDICEVEFVYRCGGKLRTCRALRSDNRVIDVEVDNLDCIDRSLRQQVFCFVVAPSDRSGCYVC